MDGPTETDQKTGTERDPAAVSPHRILSRLAVGDNGPQTPPSRKNIALLLWICASALTLFSALTALTLFAASNGAWPDTRRVAVPIVEPTSVLPTTSAPADPTTPDAEDTSAAYYASAGTCVYGLNAGAPWFIEPCQSGNFTVEARLTGTTDAKDCAPTQGGWAEYWTETDSYADVLLCLQMNYPSPIGYAGVGDCYHMTGSGSSMQFAAVGSCSAGNVQVTGYTNTYDDPSYCSGSNGWFSWQPSEYADLAYTVCFDDL